MASESAPAAEVEQSSLSGFPKDPSEFDSDPRISFSKLDEKFILETDDGQEYEYDGVLKRWVLSVCLSPFIGEWMDGGLTDRSQVDRDLLQQQQEAYKVQGVDDEQTTTVQQLKRKRKEYASTKVCQNPGPLSFFRKMRRF